MKRHRNGREMLINEKHPEAKEQLTLLKKYHEAYNTHVVENTDMDTVSAEMFIAICEKEHFKHKWASHLKLDMFHTPSWEEKAA